MTSFDKVNKYYDRFMKQFALYREKEIVELLDLKGNETIAKMYNN